MASAEGHGNAARGPIGVAHLLVDLHPLGNEKGLQVERIHHLAVEEVRLKHFRPPGLASKAAKRSLVVLVL